MKRASIVFALALVLGILASGAAGAAAFNGDFEAGWTPAKDNANSDIPDGWTPRANNYDLIEPSFDFKYEGDVALHVVTSAREGAQVLNSVGVPVRQGYAYVVSYWVYVKEGGIRMSVVDNTEPRFYPAFNKHSFAEDFADGQWQYNEIVFIPPDGCKELRLSIVQSTEREVDRTEAYFDAIRITEVSQ